MIRTITARELFDQVADRMKLRWSAGQRGEHRLAEPGENLQRRPSLVGYLNIIYPNKVQIVGIDELKYLDALDSRQRWDLREAAEETQTPIWVSAKRGHEVLTYMQYHLSRALARNTSLHGVFMEVYSIGVLITGDAGAGKSELALELITRGHRLIARCRGTANHPAGGRRPQPSSTGRGGDAHFPAQEQGHRPRTDLHRPPSPPDA